MTISIKAFEKISKGVKTSASWNTDGSISITQDPAPTPAFETPGDRLNFMDQNHKWISLIPSQLREICIAAIKAKRRGREKATLVSEEERLMPGLFPYPSVFSVLLSGNRVEIYENRLLPYLPPKEVMISVPIGQLRLILNRCISRMRHFDKTCGIRPLFGGIIRKDTTKKLEARR
jgi:hypothetical protein